MAKRPKVAIALFGLLVVCVIAATVIGLFALRGRILLQLNGSGSFLELWLKEARVHGEEKPGPRFEVTNYEWKTREVYTVNLLSWPPISRRKEDVLIVELTVHNDYERSLPIAFCWMSDKDGRRFEPVLFDGINIDEDLSTAIIPPHSTVRGRMAFRAPRNYAPLRLYCEKYGWVAKIP